MGKSGNQTGEGPEFDPQVRLPNQLKSLLFIATSMTIGIALKYSTGVILGSDSQVTLSNEPYKSQGTKIEQIGNKVGVVAAGSMDFYRELVRRLHERRDEIDASDTAHAADIVSGTMADLYLMFARRFGKDRIEDVVPLAPVGVLVAGVDGREEPTVFSVRPPGIYGPVERYDLAGSGTFYAGMVLKKHYRPGMSFPDAARNVIRAISETAEMDPYVGGEMRLGIIDPAWCGEDTPFRAELAKEYSVVHHAARIRDEDLLVRAVLDELPEADVPEGAQRYFSELHRAAEAFLIHFKQR